MITTHERAPDELEPFKKLIEALNYKLRVASPGIIESFDAVAQTVVVRLAIREKINIAGVVEDVEIPLLVDVPILIPRAGGFSLTLPVAVGDECLVIFGDNCMDSWWQSGGVQNQFERRRHSLSDGFALLGLWSQPKKLSSYATDAAQLRSDNGNTMVEVKSGEITVSADAVYLSNASALYRLIDERFADLFDAHVHTTAFGLSGVPTVLVSTVGLNTVATSKTGAG